jgi:hypothetical protein
VAPSKKLTVPVGELPATEAVSVTDCPYVMELELLVSEVVVDAAAGETEIDTAPEVLDL